MHEYKFSLKEAETILAALQSQPVDVDIDIEALKQSPVLGEGFSKTLENLDNARVHGYNQAIDHLHTKGYLNTHPFDVALAKKLIMEVHTFNDGLVSELDLGQKVVEIAKEYNTPPATKE